MTGMLRTPLLSPPPVHLLKRTLQKCERNGWMEQISGKGFSGTFQLCFPYYPR